MAMNAFGFGRVRRRCRVRWCIWTSLSRRVMSCVGSKDSSIGSMSAGWVSIRRFLGFVLPERLPDHWTFSHTQTQHFADSSVFEQLFTVGAQAVH
jgi:hypothetical protein